MKVRNQKSEVRSRKANGRSAHFVFVVACAALVTFPAATVLVLAAASNLGEHQQTVDRVTWTARHCAAYRLPGGAIDIKACSADPSTIFFSAAGHNLETNAGLDWQASVMGNTSAPPATANYIALTADTGAPAAADTSLASEITTNGLARTQGTYAHTGGAGSFTISHTWTASGTQAVNKAGLLNASSAGTLAFETAVPNAPVNMSSGDTLAVTWTISY